jgi:hypothetical protein
MCYFAVGAALSSWFSRNLHLVDSGVTHGSALSHNHVLRKARKSPHKVVTRVVK